MSRGLHVIYKLIKIEHDIAYYAYGGSNFSYPYEKEIFESMDGRIQIPVEVLNQDIADAIVSHRIQIIKPCHYAESNFEGYDIFALNIIRKIIVTCQKTNQWPENGIWVC